MSASAALHDAATGAMAAAAVLVGGVWLLANCYHCIPATLTRLEAAAGRGLGERTVPVDDRHPVDADDRLPTVDVILVAHEAASVVERTVRTVREADYPPDRLRLHVVTAPGDEETRTALASLAGRYAFAVLTVPAAYPGEPSAARALNYGFERSDGDIVGVVAPGRLVAPELFRDAARALAGRGADVACSPLDVATDGDGWFAVQLRAEYGWWYRVVLPGLARLGYPVPLGGTTCFFTRPVLDATSDARRERDGEPAWDAADRRWLARHGYAGAIPWAPESAAGDAELGLFLWERGCRFELLRTPTREAHPTSLVGPRRRQIGRSPGRFRAPPRSFRQPSAGMRAKHHLLWQSLVRHLGPLNVAGVAVSLLVRPVSAHRVGIVAEVALGLGLAFAVATTALVSYGYWTASDGRPRARLRRTAVVAFTLPAYWLLSLGATLSARNRFSPGRSH